MSSEFLTRSNKNDLQKSYGRDKETKYLVSLLTSSQSINTSLVIFFRCQFDILSGIKADLCTSCITIMQFMITKFLP